MTNEPDPVIIGRIDPIAAALEAEGTSPRVEALLRALNNAAINYLPSAGDPYGTLTEKLVNGEYLTYDELTTIYRDSGDLLAACKLRSHEDPQLIAALETARADFRTIFIEAK